MSHSKFMQNLSFKTNTKNFKKENEEEEKKKKVRLKSISYTVYWQDIIVSRGL